MTFAETAGVMTPAVAAAGYSGWVRSAMTALASEPDAAILFDTTIQEPTELLAGVVRRAFDGAVTDRYESVFAAGNRFVAAAVARRCGVTPEQVVTATGATSALWLVLRALVAPGDHVIVERPCLDLLPAIAEDAGAQVSFLPRRAPDFGVDPETLERLVRPNTRAVVLTQLHNPSGAMLDDAALLQLAALARRRGFYIVVDEVYADFAGPGRSAVQLGPEFISVSSLTKVYGLFALKCGWAAGSSELVARVRAANPQGDFGVSKLAHAVAALVLEDPAPFEAHWKAVLAAARPTVGRHAAAMIGDGLLEGDLPALGCMYFPKVVGVEDTNALAEWLWEHRRVLVTPGEFFGEPGYVRIGFGGDPAALGDHLGRLHAALRDYRARPGSRQTSAA